MIQIFLKKTKITSHDWDIVYQKIVSITDSFPLKLVRIEAYNGFSPELDKEHFDLYLEKNTIDEHISFYSDSISYTSGTTVKFYKNWNKQIKNGLIDNEHAENKPITWCPPKKFKDDGSLPEANGCALEHGYIDTHGALYEYALLAIGIMLENEMPGRVFMTAIEQEEDNIIKVVEWLKQYFQKDFDMPFYFDKPRLLDSFIDNYEEKKQAVGRMENLYRKQFKRNIEFAIKHIGYQPTFDFYSEVLSEYSFGTFGFSDVLDPWIAVTKDLESALNLIAESKRILLHEDDEYSQRKAKEYDLTHTLKSLLNDFVLWTPQQREELYLFYTNKEALETGHEDLLGSLMRIGGYRIDICPIYATKDSLFEAFMYHDPKSGTKYLKIIDEWIENNSDSYEKFKKGLFEAEEKIDESAPSPNDDEDINLNYDINNFASQYPEHEQFFIAKALKANPVFMNIQTAIETLHKSLWNIYEDPKNQEQVQRMLSESKAEKIKYIRYRLKDLRLSINPIFEHWLEKEEDRSVLFFLRILVSLKIYDRNQAYTRHIMLWDRRYWLDWKTGEKYAV